jgi:hypothetical protein
VRGQFTIEQLSLVDTAVIVGAPPRPKNVVGVRAGVLETQPIADTIEVVDAQSALLAALGLFVAPLDPGTRRVTHVPNGVGGQVPHVVIDISIHGDIRRDIRRVHVFRTVQATVDIILLTGEAQAVTPSTTVLVVGALMAGPERWLTAQVRGTFSVGHTANDRSAFLLTAPGAGAEGQQHDQAT